MAAVAPAPTEAVTEVGRAEPVASPPAVEAAAPAPEREPEPQPAEPAAPPVAHGPAPDLQRVRDLWPAAVDAVTIDNGMVGAFLGAARPIELDGERLMLAFKPDATFGKKKCEDNRVLIQTALRALTGHHLQIECRCQEVEDTEAAPVTLSHDELVERLKDQFAATEVFDDPAPTGDVQPCRSSRT